MKTKNGYRFLILIFFLAFCLIHTADARADEPACPEGWQEFVWAADDGEFVDIKDDDSSITYTDDGLLIDILRKNYFVSYVFEIPKTGKNYLRWHANLQVRNTTGGETPGISFDNGSIGISFCVYRNLSLGSFKLTSEKILSSTIAAFDVPKFDYPCTIGMRYDVVTHELTAYLNNEPVKKITLPYYWIPAIANTREVCIQTTTRPRSSMGNVLYGDLTLWAQ